ncbi:MAG TPA: UDP-N-acetylmuramate dehydrogenase [Atribacteraceae bacterium]|nr:UDP-N-acetylmuramate dehydrogenase [Atribacteraceae bacterium]
MEGRHLLVWEDLILLRRELAKTQGWDFLPEPEMRCLTTWKIGGKAKALVKVRCVEALNRLIAFLDRRGITWRILGKGSNILVDDRGFNGVVIILEGDFAQLELVGSCEIEAGSGTRLIKLVSLSLFHGLTGVEFLVGVPGTIGGALLVNAGCFGQEIGRLAKQILVRNGDGTTRWLEQEEAGFTYRHSTLRLKRHVILKARFHLLPSPPEAVREKIRNYNLLRKKTQPIGYPSAGSVFKNPTEDYAARIIEAMGFKGIRVGDAQVSTRHSNFIINRGRATYREVHFLIEWIRSEVYRKRGIILENEIEVW